MNSLKRFILPLVIGFLWWKFWEENHELAVQSIWAFIAGLVILWFVEGRR